MPLALCPTLLKYHPLEKCQTKDITVKSDNKHFQLKAPGEELFHRGARRRPTETTAFIPVQ